MNKILLVEDQREFHLIVSKVLNDSQNEVVIATTSTEALEKIQKNHFDLVLLDITLPEKNGLDFYAELQDNPETKNLPVIFLTGDESPMRKITAFTLGAEDYITKPFHHQEFKARVTSKIKKAQASKHSQTDFKMGPFHFKLSSQRVYDITSGAEIHLTPKEFRLLCFMAQNDDVVMSRERLLDQVWGQETHITDRTVDANIYLLRKKLGEHGHYIEAVIGQGYRFSSQQKQKKAV